MKSFVLMVICLLTGYATWASIAMTSFESPSNHKIQVIINGKVINEEPKRHVKIKAPAGTYTLTIKTFSENNRLIHTFRSRFYAKPGFASDYQLRFTEDDGIQLKYKGGKVIYHERLRRPDRFYNNPLLS